MLIDTIKKTCREISEPAETVQPVVAVPAFRPAANTSNFEQAETQARRHRRQRRADRAAQRNINGWTLRAW